MQTRKEGLRLGPRQRCFRLCRWQDWVLIAVAVFLHVIDRQTPSGAKLSILSHCSEIYS